MPARPLASAMASFEPSDWSTPTMILLMTVPSLVVVTPTLRRGAGAAIRVSPRAAAADYGSLTHLDDMVDRSGCAGGNERHPVRGGDDAARPEIDAGGQPAVEAHLLLAH